MKNKHEKNIFAASRFIKTPKKVPELLAPAGSLDSFHAAISAGADAVYLGLNEFNARLRAKNFTLKTLSFLVPYAHKNKVKIHITLNTLVKQHELHRLIPLLSQLEEIGVDAVIIQDLGVASIIRRYTPALRMHASTQMTIHNSACVNELKHIGIQRVILARELSFLEIEAIHHHSPIELEVFIHGALCYSISGLCLASSYLGGHSGNRGSCKQVCRRQFTTGKKTQFYFSPKDFQALTFVSQFKSLGITSLKIEGRMKNAEYVYAVVSAYRKVLDNPELLSEAKKQLEEDFGREKTEHFLQSLCPCKNIVSQNISGTGQYLGKIKGVKPDYFEVLSPYLLECGDTIRIHHEDRQKNHSVKIKKITTTQTKQQIYCNDTVEIKKGYQAYRIGRKSAIHTNWSHSSIDVKPKKYQQNPQLLKRYLQKTTIHRPKKGGTKHSLYMRINDLKWLTLMKSTPCKSIIFQGDRFAMGTLIANKKLLGEIGSRLIIALPPFIPEHEIGQWKSLIDGLYHRGVTQWMCSQFGEKTLFPPSCTIFADYSIWCLNQETQNLLLHNGYNFFCYSPEDDVLNLKIIGHSKGLFTLFSYIPLFISRINPQLEKNSFLTEKKGDGYIATHNNNLWYLLGEKPLCLTHRRDKLAAMGIINFVVDVSFCPVNKKTLKTVLSHYYNKMKIQNTTLFNHKSGFK